MSTLSMAIASRFGKRNLGTMYHDGAAVFHKGDPDDGVYVVQDGSVELVLGCQGCENRVALLKKGDLFGVSSLIGAKQRDATARAVGDAWVMKMDKELLIKKIHTDPALAYSILTNVLTQFQGVSEAVPSKCV